MPKPRSPLHYHEAGKIAEALHQLCWMKYLAEHIEETTNLMAREKFLRQLAVRRTLLAASLEGAPLDTTLVIADNFHLHYAHFLRVVTGGKSQLALVHSRKGRKKNVRAPVRKRTSRRT